MNNKSNQHDIVLCAHPIIHSVINIDETRADAGVVAIPLIIQGIILFYLSTCSLYLVSRVTFESEDASAVWCIVHGRSIW